MQSSNLALSYFRTVGLKSMFRGADPVDNPECLAILKRLQLNEDRLGGGEEYDDVDF